ncbi:hypothetical protein [Massilia sp. TWR1-2-2]|uniref:hypothetical protein n=1 Tax=Massilia sp. TWR1-2-2 TaxID=2804584 RepID=UPI003CFA42EF
MNQSIDANIKKLAAIAYGEASTLNDENEIAGIAFAVANRCRAWGGKTVQELLAADEHYTYAIDGNNQRYENFVRTRTMSEIENDKGMKIAWRAALIGWANEGRDPSNGAFWWDGLDFKTNYAKHRKVRDGFRFGSESHNIFRVPERSSCVTVYRKLRDKNTGKDVDSKVRGQFNCVWVSTAAHGQTIFWTHDKQYLATSGGKAYR